MTDEVQGTEGRLPPIERGRSLTFVERRGKARALSLAAADFLVQLIASQRRLGDYRRAKRRDPRLAAGEYKSAEAERGTGFELRV